MKYLTKKQFDVLELLKDRKLHTMKQIQAMVPWDFNENLGKEPSYSGIAARVHSLEKQGYLFCKGLFRGWDITEKGVVAMVQYKLREL